MIGNEAKCKNCRKGFVFVGYCKEVLLPIGIVTLSSFVLPLMLSIIMDKGILSFCAVCGVALLSVCFFTFTLGMTKNERLYFVGLIKSKIHKI